MSDLPVSVIIVSRGRPADLTRCLLGVSQLQYDAFEVIVVADPEGVKAAKKAAFSDALKLIPFDQPNISAARNIGLASAAGEVVAFIDDDAVPEPQWLRHLIAPAAQPHVAAMGGFVRGRNGISYQWKGRSLDALGAAHDLEIEANQATILTPPAGRAIKTEGTNMAFRRDVLIELGGFDPAFHYFLDETDVNMRLAKAGHVTALVPLAEVHHGFAANKSRTKARVPRDLFDIGASWAVFQRKHVNPAEHDAQWQNLREGQRKRLLTHMVAGNLEPGAVRRLMKQLDKGRTEGLARTFGPAKFATHPAESFKRFPAKARKSVFLHTRPLRARKDHETARERVKNGEIVTLLNLSRTAIYHRTWFDADGVWLQKGGLFGKSDRKMPLFHLITRKGRVSIERTRVASQRGLSDY